MIAYGATMTSTFGTVLKEWRGIRRMSQLDLGSMADVSSRHISFLESGRSNPSRAMVLHLTEILDVPRQERNRFLGAAGFAPQFETHDPQGSEMQPIREAVRWTLDRHDPFPAIVLDRHWNVVDSNASAELMFAFMGIDRRVNMIELFVEDSGIRDLIENWPEVGYHLLTRFRTESAAVGGDAILDGAIAALLADDSIGPPLSSPLPPAIPMRVRIGDSTVSLFSTIAQFGSAEDIALADQRVELFFPADDATRELFVAASGDAGG